MIIERSSAGRIIFNYANYALLGFVVAVTLYPFLYVVAASLSSSFYIRQGMVGIIPRGFNLDSYIRVLAYPMIGRAYLNTVFYTLLGTAVNLTLTSFGAFVLARKRLIWKKFFLGLIVFPMLFNGGLIPTFLVVKGLGLYNNIAALILPGAIWSFYLIVMRTFFLQIPDSLEESAVIDGCNEIQTLFAIILPLSLPALATIGLFYAVNHWNSFFQAMIYLKDRDLFPMQIMLREIVIQNQVTDIIGDVSSEREFISEGVKFATIIVATLPILLVYPFIQKYFVKGVMIGAVKG